MTLIELHEGMCVEVENIIGIEDDGEYGTHVYVKWGNEVRSFFKAVPYATMLGILSRAKEEPKTPAFPQDVAKNIEQLAKFNTNPAW